MQSELTPEDWVEFQRLCQPGSPDFILDLPDYYAFYTYSMFRGKVPSRDDIPPEGSGYRRLKGGYSSRSRPV